MLVVLAILTTTTNNNNDNDDDRVKRLNVLYARAREKMKETAVGDPPGQLSMSTKQALEEIKREDLEKAKHTLDKLIESNPEVFSQLRQYEGNPSLMAKKIDQDIIVPFLKQEQSRDDENFERFKEAYHPNDPERFDALLAELRKKGFLM